ncbi:D-alanyl-D-alanine carboxypeptidase family protein [Paraherbaspirillum soli]|uniref:serine-type D-Ala-D-Ala carboxypeptidase n=1 Tax=Paraherbaspirillum soli TaxID=631222 RepID=A0ABW0MA07_9BURK
MKRIPAVLALNYFVFSMAWAESPAAPAVAAKSWLLLDVTSEHVIASHEPELRVEPASLVKLMTGYLACAAIDAKKIDMAQMVNVSTRAWKVDRDGSKMFIEPGKPVSVQDLLYGLIVQSGNDAAVAIAEAVSGTEEAFVAEMNGMADIMGLKNTRFANSHGLPSADNYSTAGDLAILATHVVEDYPECYKIYAVKSFTYNKITQPNRNRLLSLDANIDGIKTGYTEASGYSLIASANRPSGTGTSTRRLIAVVLGAPSGNVRTQESQKLLHWGFQNFDTVKLYGRGQAIATPAVWKGLRKQVKVGFAEDVFVTLPKGDVKKLKPVLEMNDPLLAPIFAGNQLGHLKVAVDGAVLLTRPIVALEDVEQANIFARMVDAVWLWIKK